MSYIVGGTLAVVVFLSILIADQRGHIRGMTEMRDANSKEIATRKALEESLNSLVSALGNKSDAFERLNKALDNKLDALGQLNKTQAKVIDEQETTIKMLKSALVLKGATYGKEKSD